ncbi:hypothetical protein, variant [Phytophthora nicotianae CJ01A1]|uniref:Uncharacterized protein n=3 Tax=Phytophthora nicotianae TaxID=4792 RepID=V9E559_PHYNI|nr:hypothetical protein F443_19346 [Phytophthora nicotianae P1569]ETK74431.1 hypothetical protein L915_18771 [Phytophthora nicotianae]ETP03955.1 hypothetical protein F441_19169 [Phytophthora nicotianae CJ01A1]ETI34086.1 hypothetical protein, variant [Phytophthora nicotianae P1569]ETK74432.1 hypothetical protein, variant [Phytophthora nicotianae]
MMDTEVLQKGKKARCRVIQDKDAQEAQPGVYTAKKEDVQKAQAQRLGTLENTVSKEPGQRVSLFDMVLDSNSFEQTVENVSGAQWVAQYWSGRYHRSSFS